MEKNLIITLGDPYSINVELCLPFLSERRGFPLILIGSEYQWLSQSKALEKTVVYKKIKDLNEAYENEIYFLDIGGEEKLASSMNLQERGYIACQSLYALKGILEDSQQNLAVITCPIDKKAAHEAGFPYPGHTEFFTELSKVSSLMLLAGPRLKVALASQHVPLSKVSSLLTETLILSKISILHQSLKDSFGIQHPRIAVCGLNPHCGDGGLFGDEEERIIRPAILKSPHKNITGPLPADTVFYRCLQGDFDAVLAMYHDQGLGPLKTVHFDEAVNITCGLPYLRVSPDHGPAKDLFLQGRASRRSMEEAWKLACQYLERE